MVGELGKKKEKMRNLLCDCGGFEEANCCSFARGNTDDVWSK
jgi:hypothetical protein